MDERTLDMLRRGQTLDPALLDVLVTSTLQSWSTLDRERFRGLWAGSHDWPAQYTWGTADKRLGGTRRRRFVAAGVLTEDRSYSGCWSFTSLAVGIASRLNLDD